MSQLTVNETALKHALSLDQKDPLGHLREEFRIPTNGELRETVLHTERHATDRKRTDRTSDHDETESIYLCGNSLGLQPRCTRKFVDAHLETWASNGVYGHFKQLTETPIVPWLDMDDAVASPMASIMGAKPTEVAVMQTLTANLHLLMASFYRPTKERHKIVLEGKAFPSDHYMVESQIRHHVLDPAASMVVIDPPADSAPLLTTDYIISTIDAHAESTALVLLPGVQFYTGQLFDIAKITAHAHSKGIVIGWDLAHAAGNIPLQLHDWDVDFAAWCTYKYLNCGPGAIGGLFVHERHSQLSSEEPISKTSMASSNLHEIPNSTHYKPRLSGWWGSTKSTRFAMENKFTPTPGAAGWQLSNPSALDMAAVMASLSVFGMTDIEALRKRSLRLTGYLESLLLTRRDQLSDNHDLGSDKQHPFKIITPSDPAARGAQLSILLSPGLLEAVMKSLQDAGVVVDERRPDVIRVAPAPLYNSFEDVWRFVDVFIRAMKQAVRDGECSSIASGMKAVMGDAGPNGGGLIEGERRSNTAI